MNPIMDRYIALWAIIVLTACISHAQDKNMFTKPLPSFHLVFLGLLCTSYMDVQVFNEQR